MKRNNRNSKSRDRKTNEALKAAKHRMVLNAVRHLSELDARTGRAFQAGGVLKYPIPMQAPEFLEQIAMLLRDPGHPLRLQVMSGPLLFRRVAPDSPNVESVSVIDLLLTDSSAIRTAALAHFETLADGSASAITPRSALVISQRQQELRSDDLNRWVQAALAVSDALHDDWLCNLAGLRQSMQVQFNEGVADHLDRVLRPTTRAIDSINLEWWEPRQQQASLEASLLSLFETEDDLPHALDVYLDRFGHLPFAEGAALSRLIADWENREAAPTDMWDTLWRWADRRATPLARYHTCQAFLCLPHLVPEDGTERLWAEVADILDAPDRQGDDRSGAQMWQVRCELAKHYHQYLDCLVPWNGGERIAILSWWLSERVAQLFGNDEDLIQHFREAAIKPVAAISDRQWLFAHPVAEASALRYATLYAKSVWSLSLQTFIGDHLGHLSPGRMHTDSRTRVTQVMVETLWSGFALDGTDSKVVDGKTIDARKVTYAFERTLLAGTEAWISAGLTSEQDSPGNPEPENLDQAMRAWIAGVQTLNGPTALMEALASLETLNEPLQTLVCLTLRTAAYTQRLDPAAVWRQLEDHEWRTKVFQSGSVGALNALFMALQEMQVSQGEVWSYFLPHFYATASEAADGDPERRKILFGCVVLTSLNSDTVSALQRLLRGTGRHSFIEDVAYWRERIEEVRHELLPWVAARVRSVNANLHVS